MRLQPYLSSYNILTCPTARNGEVPTNWASRGVGSIGYTTATAYDPADIEGFSSLTRVGTMANPAETPLFGDTLNGPTTDKYRGYVFDPYNGQDNAVDPQLGTPLVSDRDLVKELSALPPAALKPLYARHFAKGDDSGRAMLIFGDGHASFHSAASILVQENGARLLWRFRPRPRGGK